MSERVSKLLGTRLKRGINLSTFHSLGLKILRDKIELLGLSKDFTIYDSADQLSIVREGLKRYTNADKNAYDKKTIMAKIGTLKNAGISEDAFASSDYFNPDDPYDVATESIYRYYQDKLHFYNAVDFDDILYLTVKLFQQNPEVAKEYSRKFKYIMIDEYQDTNKLQFAMVRAVTSTHSNICVVGDDDQSIYAFRGADITNILSFEKLFDNTKVIKLEQNYRSTPNILNLANAVIKQNKKRKDKTMFSTNAFGKTPKVWSCADSDHEAQVVIDEIIKIQKQGRFLGEVALLYRSNTQVPPFEDQLRLAQVPYTIIGGQKFYEKKEIKDLIAFLSIIHNTKNELGLRRVINIPHRGVGTKSLKDFLEVSKATGKTLYQVVKEFSRSEDSKKAHALAEFFQVIELSRSDFKTMKLHEALISLVDRFHYFNFIEKSYDSPKIVARKKDDVKNFILSAERFSDRFKQEATLGLWLERLLLAETQDNSDKGDGIKNEVQCMTYHSSKGLEFDTVFMVGCEEELLPHKNTIKEDGDIDEERRLCYVGITRAKKDLTMTFAQKRRIYGKDILRNRSRFLVDLDEHIQDIDKNSFSHMTEEEEVEYKSNFFNDLLQSLD